MGVMSSSRRLSFKINAEFSEGVGVRSSSWPPGKLKRIHRDRGNVTTTTT